MSLEDKPTEQNNSNNDLLEKPDIPPETDDSSDEDYEIKITLKPRKHWDSYTQEEIDELEKKYGECDYCYSLRLPEHMYKGHYSESCPRLKKMRCDHCAVYGHTGGHCPTSTKKLIIKCTFCFRGGKLEQKYNSHTTETCIDKKIYDGEYQGGSYYSKPNQSYQRYNNGNSYTHQNKRQTSDFKPAYTSNSDRDFPPLSKK